MAKRIFAMLGAALLIGLYVITLVFGLMQSEKTTPFLVASIVATIILPVLLYAYQLVYRLLKKRNKDKENG